LKKKKKISSNTLLTGGSWNIREKLLISEPVFSASVILLRVHHSQQSRFLPISCRGQNTEPEFNLNSRFWSSTSSFQVERNSEVISSIIKWDSSADRYVSADWTSLPACGCIPTALRVVEEKEAPAFPSGLRYF